MKKHQVGNLTVEIKVDEAGTAYPFEHEDEASFGMDLSGHRDYSSPTYGADMPVTMEDYMAWRHHKEDCEDKLKCYRFEATHYVLPVYIYDHSGRAIRTTSFSCRWDSGLAGFAYAGKKEFQHSGIRGVKPSMKAIEREAWAFKYLRGQVQVLNDLLAGNIWGYVITDPDGEELESCWGYAADEMYCEAEAISAAKRLLK